MQPTDSTMHACMHHCIDGNLRCDDWETTTAKSVTQMIRLMKTLYLFRAHERVATTLRDSLSRKHTATQRIACAIHRHKQLQEAMRRNPGSLLLHAMDAWTDYEQRCPQTVCPGTLYELTLAWHRQKGSDGYDMHPVDPTLDNRQNRQDPRDPDTWNTTIRQQSQPHLTQSRTRFLTPEQQLGALVPLRDQDQVARQLQMGRDTDLREDDARSDACECRHAINRAAHNSHTDTNSPLRRGRWRYWKSQRRGRR